jgi:murein DD-endopeptidase MepM/ murein hydrolase activator NlpD
MAGIIHPTTTANIGFGFGSTGASFYEDRMWHGDFYENFHGGIDYWGPLDYPVVACANGIVLYAGFAVPYIGGAGGNGVVISHGPNMKSIYGHLNSINVGAGQAVVSGQKIGGIGQSGVANGVIHLHFEIRTTTAAWGEDVENPNIFLPGGTQSGSSFANDTGDIPWLEPLAGTVIKAALCNPVGLNQWALPTGGVSVVMLYADRMLVTPSSYSVSDGVITFVSDISSETEVRADYTTA